MSIIGIDLGWKRIGIAIAEDGLDVALPNTTIVLSHPGSIEETLARLIEHIRRVEAHTAVIGLPKHLKGSEGESAQRARRIADELRRACKIEVVLQDERLSTKEAEARMRMSGIKKRNTSKKAVDPIAASIILQSYIDSHPSRI